MFLKVVNVISSHYLNIIKNPFFKLRVVYPRYSKNYPRLKYTHESIIGQPSEIGFNASWTHTADFMIPYEEYHAAHPEFFALVDGERLRKLPGQRFDVHLCFANKNARDLAAERIMAMIRELPHSKYFMVSQGDGYKWCECDECKKLDQEPNQYSDRLLFFVNYIARKAAVSFPDKIILTLVYTRTEEPPLREKPEPNVRVMYCPYPVNWMSQSRVNTPVNEKGISTLKAWIEKYNTNIFIYDYPKGYKSPFEPFANFYAQLARINFYAKNNIRGINFCQRAENFNALFEYVISAVLWEPDIDVNKKIDEFIALYYGPEAAPSMRGYFDFFYKNIRERKIDQCCERNNPGVVTPEYAKEAYKLFDKAISSAGGNSEIISRIKEEKFCVLFADINENNLLNGRISDKELPVFADKLSEFIKMARDRKISWFIRKQKGHEWFLRSAGLRFDSTELWHQDPAVNEFLDNPLPTIEKSLIVQNSIPDGIQIPVDVIFGGMGPAEYNYQCEPRKAVWITRASSEHSQMRAFFKLQKLSAGQVYLEVEGQDDDKPGRAEIKILINGKELFSGENKFTERGWSTESYRIPAGILTTDKNKIEFINITKDLSENKKNTIEFLDPADYKWGWFMLSKLKVIIK